MGSLKERNKKKTKGSKSDKQKQKTKKVVPPRRRCGRQHKNKLKQQNHHTKPLYDYELEERTSKRNNDKTYNSSAFPAAAAVCGTSSLDSFYLLLIAGLVPCYPVCPFFPAFVNRGGRGCVRQCKIN